MIGNYGNQPTSFWLIAKQVATLIIMKDNNMLIPKSKEELLSLIENQIEESLQLEYKSADSLQNDDKRKTEMCKDISAMANSQGGIIIYGIKEFDDQLKKHLPEKITPVDRTKITKEWIENVIHGNVFPRIENLIIHPINLNEPNEVAYVIEIPQSTTAHQSSDLKYYKRYNFKAQPMYDYEIRDIMNRNKYPVLDLDIVIEKRIYKEAPILPSFGKTIRTSLYIKCKLKNNGSILANYASFDIVVPKDILNKDRRIGVCNGNFVTITEDNTTRDVVGYKPMNIPQYGSARYVPILPKLSSPESCFYLVGNPILDDRTINWTIYADNAQPRSGCIKLSDIIQTELNEVDDVE